MQGGSVVMPDSLLGPVRPVESAGLEFFY